MTDAPLTFSSLAALVGLFAVVLGGIFALMRSVEARIAPKSQDKALGELVVALKEILARPGQSVQCAAQHESLRGALADNSKRFTEIVGAVHASAEATRALAHAQELRDERLALQIKLLINTIEHGNRETQAKIEVSQREMQARLDAVAKAVDASRTKGGRE